METMISAGMTPSSKSIAGENFALSPLVISVYVFMAFFLPAFSIGNSPIPLGYGLAALYFVIRLPNVPNRQLRIFVLSTVYLSIIAARNAIDDRGSARDFLYVLICIGQMFTFCMFYDLFAQGHGDRILKLMLVFATFNMFLMICQLFDIMGMNEALQPLWELPWRLVRRDDLISLHASDVGGRPYGLMDGWNVASMALYLVYRAAWVRYRLFRYRVLCLLSIIIPGARMLTIFFVGYELLAPMFVREQRKRAISFLLVGGGIAAVFLTIMSQVTKNFFLLKFVTEMQTTGLSNNYSYTNRLETLQLAKENLDRIFLFGGIHANDFLSLSRAVDSEALLRSMQFGFVGFALLNLMLYYYFNKYRTYDMFFVIGIMLWTSITFTAASNFVFTPFLLLYAFVCRDAAPVRRLS